MKRKIELGMAVVLLFAVAILGRKGAALTAVSSTAAAEKEEEICIAIDAGHGGDDPGKIGINGALEKDINLVIALKLKLLLESQDIKVVMTRETGEGLYTSGTQNKKVQDMRKRCDIITEAMPEFTVSIHQNSYPEEYVKGAQVFYYGNSKEGKELSEFIQKSLVDRIDPENHRQAKANESYYLLKKTPTPTIIVECGFLSNQEEAELLSSEDYQNRIVWAIHMGIMQYLNTAGRK